MRILGAEISIRDVVLPEPAEPKPTATSASSGPVAPEQAPAGVAPAPVGPVKILFISANAKDGDQLALDEEYRAIEQRIRLARHRDAFQPIFKPAARRDDLQYALLEHSPHIVHFSCHVSSQAEIVLRGDGPASDPVATDSFASLFSVLHDNVVLIVFNACFASTQASAIRRSAKVVFHAGRLRARCAPAPASGAIRAPGGRRQQAVSDQASSLSRAAHGARRRGDLCRARGGRGRLWSDPDPGTHHPPPVRGMVRFAAADVRPGGFDPDKGGGIPMVANQPTVAPARNAEIVLDNQPGQEALYLIVSRHELSRANAGLADVLAAARPGREATDCGAPFQAAVAGSRKGTNWRRGWNGGRRGAGAAPPAPNPDLGKPVVEIQRGGYVEFGGAQSSVEADPDGVVVLRYELTHISAGM